MICGFEKDVPKLCCPTSNIIAAESSEKDKIIASQSKLPECELKKFFFCINFWMEFKNSIIFSLIKFVGIEVLNSSLSILLKESHHNPVLGLGLYELLL